MRAGGVVDTVTTRPRRAAFKAAELIGQALGFRQRDPATVQERKQIPVKIGLRLFGAAILNTVLAEKFSRKFAAVSVTGDE